MNTAYAFAGAPSVDAQLAALTAALDPYTCASLTDAGVGPGWQVLDAGAGSGTIAAWLADTVGPSGHVTATDLDISRLPAHDRITPLQHDITADPMPDTLFDLIHARLVLIHLPDREKVLRRLAAALKPGGALVLHEFDCTWRRPVHTAPTPEDAALFHEVITAINRLLTTAGARLDWGIAAHQAMTDAGLEQVTTHAYAENFHGGSPWAQLGAINTIQLHDQLLNLGLIETKLDRYRHLMAIPAFNAMSYLVTRTVGTRPR